MGDILYTFGSYPRTALSSGEIDKNPTWQNDYRGITWIFNSELLKHFEISSVRKLDLWII